MAEAETFCAPRERITASSTAPIGIASETDAAAWRGAEPLAVKLVPAG